MLTVQRVPLAQLVPDPQNARSHDEKNLAAIRSSLTKFGQVEPLVARKGTNVVIGGNGRLEAMRTLEWTHADVTYFDGTDAEARALGLALNRTAELAAWDDGRLAAALAEVKEAGLLDAVGWTDADVAAVMEGVRGDVVEDDVPEPPADPVTKAGDLWVLGKHRLLCGDSTKAEDVRRLMAGGKAAIMNTDPPYGVSYANDDRPNPGVAKPRVANDTLADEKLQSFLESCFRAAVELALLPNAAWYMWHAHLTQGYFAAAAAAANVVLHRQIIWVKPVLLLGRGQYHWKHEPCFMGWVKGQQPPDYGEGKGERTQTTVWEIGSVTQAERKEFNHATPKPVSLFAIPIIKHTRPGELCYEPFSGSGPQLIAAEQLDRRCYGMEISPAYCEVIVKRWETLTGKNAVLER